MTHPLGQPVFTPRQLRFLIRCFKATGATPSDIGFIFDLTREELARFEAGDDELWLRKDSAVFRTKYRERIEMMQHRLRQNDRETHATAFEHTQFFSIWERKQAQSRSNSTGVDAATQADDNANTPGAP